MTAPQIEKPYKSNHLQVLIPGGGRWVRPWLVNLGIPNNNCMFDRQSGWWHITVRGAQGLTDLREALRRRYGWCYVATHHKRSDGRCDTRCVNAQGPECVCSCGGANHGGSYYPYTLVSETTLVDLQLERTVKLYGDGRIG